jgi:CheY-like chemotaxis protein
MIDAGPARVCVLDDSQTSLDIISAALETRGFEVHTFSSAFDVSSQFEVIQPHVIVVDLNMPALQGDAVIDILRRNTKHRCAVILYSAAAEPELKRRAEACGADAYVRKSRDANQLVHVVSQQIQKQR